MDRLKQRGADLVYRCGKGHTELMQSDKYSGELVLTPLEPPPKSKPRPPPRYLWAALIARIYEVFPLICANCGGQMRITSVHHIQRRHPPPDYSNDQRTTW